MTIYLNELLPGQSAFIVGIEENSTLRQRLMELGVREGKQVFMRRRAPLGDPMEVNVMGTNLSIRKSEARYVMIDKVVTCPGNGKMRGLGKGLGRRHNK
ncbi:FeoA family protein [Haliovirga abyssi]|uniref:Ferrous iron transporter FeoA-like domain-containing protein n=1 Tax=Haliovirga abyssi TaxID=2996794 RepID=A0AAU9DVW6_9FUSO|nr:FeoA family protein [Haliovirga abyssi]BDU50371.1 hypothetical protein HLVA_09400 [Haliovirga abyssi]